MNLNAPLPIDHVLGDVTAALAVSGAAVLRAPPGAGKTTRVPLALVSADWLAGQRIVMLEPRRLAARAAASRMAAQLGEAVGATVGYRMRLDTRVSRHTRIEVVTEGVLTRMLQHDPSLDGVGLVIFDEFHERSIHADLGLALTLQAKGLFRPDLRVLVMSATIDGDPVAELLSGAPLIVSEGRVWPVETHWLSTRAEGRIEPRVVRTVHTALERETGDILVFLPGAAEIRRVETGLRSLNLDNVDVYPLFAQLPQDLQDRALAPSPAGRRKVVLATSIAETSLTIEGVRVVVDCGLMRVPRFSPRTGMSRLETMRVTCAAADQRRGRAGRTSPGTCYRLWTKAEDAGLVPQRAPEITEADLTPLALELSVWGVTDPATLAWLDSPPRGAWAHATGLLRALHAIDSNGSVTAHGRALSDIALHPRLAHMLAHAGAHSAARTAAALAAILAGRDPFSGDAARNPDLRLRVHALRAGRDYRADPASIATLRREAAQWERAAHSLTVADPAGGPEAHADDADATGPLLALAYPDRIGRRRGRTGRYLLSNGRGAFLDDASAFGDAEFLAIATLDDIGREARIQLAAPIDRADIERLFAEDIRTEVTADWDETSASVRVSRARSLGAIVLDSARINDAPGVPRVTILLDAVVRQGLAVLPWSRTAIALRERVAFARMQQPDAWPDLSDHALLGSIHDWLAPFVPDAGRLADIGAAQLTAAIETLLGWERLRALDAFAPTDIAVPSGSRITIDYTDPATPVLAVRIQELFGLRETPSIAGGAIPLTLHLLSPANRPVQVTRDLPGFWERSYFDVRKDLRGRYPRHSWPDDPLNATPTRRARPR
ncbi:MAG TPA: ATP-dependent helicase HrpB [Longimicrobiales bacterium]